VSSHVRLPKNVPTVERDPLNLADLLLGKTLIHLLGECEDIVWRFLYLDGKANVLSFDERNCRRL
jgi:hypothetical protein